MQESKEGDKGKIKPTKRCKRCQGYLDLALRDIGICARHDTNPFVSERVRKIREGGVRCKKVKN